MNLSERFLEHRLIFHLGNPSQDVVNSSQIQNSKPFKHKWENLFPSLFSPLPLAQPVPAGPARHSSLLAMAQLAPPAHLLSAKRPSKIGPAASPLRPPFSPAVRMCACTAQLPSLRPAYAARDAELHGPVPSPMGPARQPEKKGKDGDAASPSACRLPSVVLFAWYPASPSPPASSVSQPDNAARTPRPTARPRMPLRTRRLEP